MSDDRTFVHDPAGFVVVFPKGALPAAPLCCPVCACALRSRDDEASYAAYACCNACEREWVHADRDAWRAGVRPSVAAVAAVLVFRPGISIRFGQT